VAGALAHPVADIGQGALLDDDKLNGGGKSLKHLA
jgi:hypothetical protein